MLFGHVFYFFMSATAKFKRLDGPIKPENIDT